MPNERAGLPSLVGWQVDEIRSWVTDGALFQRMPDLSVTAHLHPSLANVVSQYRPSQVLDYGCGDGQLMRRLASATNVFGFDPSVASVHAVPSDPFERFGGFFQATEEIPAGQFDVVVSSMVLMTAPTRAELHAMVAEMVRAVRPGGKLVAAVTHPCFRDHVFSDFFASFATDGRFDYSRSGARFEVTLLDWEKRVATRLWDYHWTLSDMTAAIEVAGGAVAGVIETPDRPGQPFSNTTVPAFLTLIANV